ncbi:TRAP transporter small permease [Bacteroidota bacterium]
MIDRIKILVNLIIEKLLIVLMAVMVLNVLWQVFTRFILNDPSSFTEELARYLLIWVGLIGAGYVTGKKMHLAIDYVINKFDDKKRFVINIFINVCTFSFALFAMLIGGINLVSLILYLEQISAALQIQLGYVYLAVPISGILIMFYSAVNIIEQFQRLNKSN